MSRLVLRKRRLRNSYLAVSVTLGALMLLVFGWLSLAIIGLDIDHEFHLDSLGAVLKLVWMVTAMIIGFVLGMGIGGRLWVLGAKLFAGLTGEEAEALFFHNQPIIPGMEQYNRWCMERVFPKRLPPVIESSATMNRLELKIPPPLLALAIGALMWWLARFTPLVEWSDQLRLAGALGLALLGVAAALAGVIHFHRARTTIHPLKPERSSALVDSGIYRFSRNPMYLGMALVLLGWSVWLTAPAALLGPPVFMAFITRFQIRPEERILEELFGEDYKHYCRRVRRWL